MNIGATQVSKVCGLATLVIIPLVAAAWLPPGFPHLLRQVLLFTWGVGAILITERMFFSKTLNEALHSLGLVRARGLTLLHALLVSLPMWTFLPLVAWTRGAAVELRPDWLQLLIGVVLVNGITEEVIHRGFVFGHLRHGRSFVSAATLSAALFAAQHLYVVVTTGWTIGLASVLLAALLSYPMGFVFERGGNSIVGPAILHTSSNAPVFIFRLPEGLMAAVLMPHMGVVLVSLYLVFTSRKLLKQPSDFLASRAGRPAGIHVDSH